MLGLRLRFLRPWAPAFFDESFVQNSEPKSLLSSKAILVNNKFFGKKLVTLSFLKSISGYLFVWYILIFGFPFSGFSRALIFVVSNNPVTVSHFKLFSFHSISSVVFVSLPLKDVSTYQHKRFLAARSFHCFHFNFFTRRVWCGCGTWNERSCFIIIVPPFQVIGVIFKIRLLPLQCILQLNFSLKSVHLSFLFEEEMSVPKNLRPTHNEKHYAPWRPSARSSESPLTVLKPNPADAVCFRTQAERQRGSCAWLAGASLWHRPCWRARQELSC